MNILGGLHKFISSLPVFEGRTLFLDYLENVTESYSLTRIDEPRIIKKYTDGGKLMEYDFSISSRKIYPDTIDAESEFFRTLSSQIKENSDKNILPDIGKNATAVEIKILSDSIRKNNNLNTARYSADFRLVYYVN